LRATLYAIPGSHAVKAGELMLQRKGIDYRRVNLPPGLHRLLVRALGFKGDRVPAVRFEDGRRAQGTRELPRVLDELVPEPRLVPDDPRALEAEAWADDVLQQWARRIVAAAGVRDPDALAGRGADGRLGPLLTHHDIARRTIARGVLRAFGVTREQIKADRERVGEILDRVDAWIAEGVLNGPELRSPDLAVASNLALAEYVLDLRPDFQGRPLMGLLDRVFSGSGAAPGRP